MPFRTSEEVRSSDTNTHHEMYFNHNEYSCEWHTSGLDRDDWDIDRYLGW